jgi:hypothetical protein
VVDERRLAILDAATQRTRLPDEFWNARPALAHIRRAAHSRNRSATAVLHVVLARLAAIIPHTIELPAIVGAPAPLNYFVVLVAVPGIGKSSANAIGAQLLPADEHVADQLPPGSGEGLAEVLFGMVTEEDDDGKKIKVKRQVRYNAFVYVDEGQTLAELGGRKGSTLLPTLRTIWTGGVIGNTNASAERVRVVPAGLYAFGVVLAMQEGKAGLLLDDVDAGTPQRFLWTLATDASIPDETPEWPGPLKVCVDRQGLDTYHVINGAGYVRHSLGVAADVTVALRAADLDRARGVSTVAPLDAHAGLAQLKVAGLLAILDGRLDITDDDWHLAGMVKAASDRVRDVVAEAVEAQHERIEAATSRRYAAREVEADAARQRRRTVDGARKIADKVWAEPDRWTRRDLYVDMRRYREVFEDALDHAITERWVTERAEPGQGDDKRVLRPGEKRPT